MATFKPCPPGTPNCQPVPTPVSTPGNGSITQNFKTFLAWGVAAIALIMLTQFLPKAAIMLTIILIVGVLLTHWKDYVSIFNASAIRK